MYFSLFNSVTDAIEILQAAQPKGEETYISDHEKSHRIGSCLKDKPKSEK